MAEKEQNSPIAIGEIEQGPSKFEQFLDRNQKNLTFLALGLVIIVAGFIIIRGLKDNKKLAAAAALTNASDATSYQDVSKSFSGTPAAGLALIATANAQWDDDKKEASISSLKTFLSDYPDHPAHSSALLNISTKLLKSGKADEASPFLTQAQEMEDPTFSPLATLLMAELKVKSGKAKDSQSALESLTSLSDDELGSYKGLIESRIKTIKAPSPPEIKPEKKKEVVTPAPQAAVTPTAELASPPEQTASPKITKPASQPTEEGKKEANTPEETPEN